MQGLVHMRDKTVAQLLERTVDILMLRAVNIPSENKSMALEAAKKVDTETYLRAVHAYFGDQYRTPRIQTAQPDLVQAFDNLSVILTAHMRFADSDFLPAKINPAFIFTGPPTRELFDKIKKQLVYLDGIQHLDTDHIGRQLDVMLALLVRDGIVT